MGKNLTARPSTWLSPLPAVLVTCRGRDGRANVLTIAWTGIVCSDPPMLSISIRPSRWSNGIIRETKEFVVCVPSADRVKRVDLCGILSGRDIDKLSEAGFTTAPAREVAPPLLAECPICLECRVTQVVPLGSHDLFLAEILATHVADEALDGKGRVRMEVVNPLSYCPPDHSYRSVGDALGHYGYSKER